MAVISTHPTFGYLSSAPRVKIGKKVVHTSTWYDKQSLLKFCPFSTEKQIWCKILGRLCDV